MQLELQTYRNGYSPSCSRWSRGSAAAMSSTGHSCAPLPWCDPNMSDPFCWRTQACAGANIYAILGNWDVSLQMLVDLGMDVYQDEFERSFLQTAAEAYQVQDPFSASQCCAVAVRWPLCAIVSSAVRPDGSQACSYLCVGGGTGVPVELRLPRLPAEGGKAAGRGGGARAQLYGPRLRGQDHTRG
jgi:hypothetical protein